MSGNLVDLGRKLLDASRNGQTDNVLALTKSGAPFTTDWLGTSPLHLAARYGHTASAEILLKAGVSRDARTKLNRTALHVAAQEGHLQMVELLLAHGADPNARDMLKMTPLHWAVQRCHISIVERLLIGGSDPMAVSKFSVTPSDMAEELGYLDILTLLQNWTKVIPVNNSNIHLTPCFLRPDDRFDCGDITEDDFDPLDLILTDTADALNFDECDH